MAQLPKVLWDLAEELSQHKSKLLVFLATKETPVSFKLVLNSTAALPCRSTLDLLNLLAFIPCNRGPDLQFRFVLV